jgi:hypothetical protein
MVGALLYRTGGDKNLTILNILLLDDIENGFEQKRVSVQEDAIHLLDLYGSENVRCQPTLETGAIGCGMGKSRDERHEAADSFHVIESSGSAYRKSWRLGADEDQSAGSVRPEAVPDGFQSRDALFSKRHTNDKGTRSRLRACNPEPDTLDTQILGSRLDLLNKGASRSAAPSGKE